MIRDVLDTHTHTIVSGHAYSTIRENAAMAAKRGLELLCITDHAPDLPGSANMFYFKKLKVVDRHAYDTELLMGVELDILDDNGKLDMPENVLSMMDICIASLHIPCIKSGGVSYNTAALVNTIKNPYVDIIGHPDDSRYPVDFEAVVRAAAEYNVLIELNNLSLRPDTSRVNCRQNDEVILGLCRKYGVTIAVGSDAHVDTEVGCHEQALSFLDEIDFPEELVINRSVDALKSYLNYRRSKRPPVA